MIGIFVVKFAMLLVVLRLVVFSLERQGRRMETVTLMYCVILLISLTSTRSFQVCTDLYLQRLLVCERSHSRLMAIAIFR